MKKLIIVLLFIFAFAAKVNADDTQDILKQQLDALNISTIDSAIKQIQQDQSTYGYSYTKNFNFSEMVAKVISGEISASPSNIINEIINGLLNEIFSNLDIMRNLIIIAVLAAILKNLSVSYGKSGVGELAFYATYVIVIIMLFTSFNTVIGIAESLLYDISMIMEALLPMFITLLVATGNVSMASAYSPLIIVASELVLKIMKDVLLPVTYAVAALQIVNFMTEKEVLSNLTELMKKCITFFVKAFSVLFMAIITLQGISAPILNNIVGKGAKAVMNSIPVVGSVLTGAVESVMYWSGALKNAASVVAIIYIVLLCAIPLLKIVSLMLIYKITAAVIQPISDNRISKCIDAIGSFTVIVLAITVSVAVMFIYSIIVVIAMSTV